MEMVFATEVTITNGTYVTNSACAKVGIVPKVYAVAIDKEND